MKIICHCGRDVRHEPPFDDFHVERVACTPSCQRIRALEQTPAPERLSAVFPGSHFDHAKKTGMLGH